MSLQSYDAALDFLPPVAKTDRPAISLLESALAMFGAVNNGIAAQRHYESLVNSGVSPRDAVENIFQSHFADK